MDKNGKRLGLGSLVLPLIGAAAFAFILAAVRFNSPAIPNSRLILPIIMCVAALIAAAYLGARYREKHFFADIAARVVPIALSAVGAVVVLLLIIAIIRPFVPII